jgi:hypothetical protein
MRWFVVNFNDCRAADRGINTLLCAITMEILSCLRRRMPSDVRRLTMSKLLVRGKETGNKNLTEYKIREIKKAPCPEIARFETQRAKSKPQPGRRSAVGGKAVHSLILQYLRRPPVAPMFFLVACSLLYLLPRGPRVLGIKTLLWRKPRTDLADILADDSNMICAVSIRSPRT